MSLVPACLALGLCGARPLWLECSPHCKATLSSCSSSMRESFPEPSQGQSWQDCPAADLQGFLCNQNQHFLGCLFSRKLFTPMGQGQVTFPWCPKASDSPSSVCLALHFPGCALRPSPSRNISDCAFVPFCPFLSFGLVLRLGCTWNSFCNPGCPSTHSYHLVLAS